MNSSLKHFSLFWGIFLNFSFTLLASQSSILLRICKLPPQHMLGSVFIGQFAATIPFFHFAWKNWTIRSRGAWIAYSVAGVSKAFNLVLWQTGTRYLALGDYTAIEISSVLFAPVLASILRRKCVKVVDIFGVIIATVGVFLIAKPQFLSRSESAEISQSIGYVCAAYGGLTIMILPFILGYFPNVHWSNYLCFGTLSTGLVAAPYLAIAGWSLPPDATLTSSFEAAVLVGVLRMTYRLCQVCACTELESVEEGMAGLMGNLINAAIIPFTTLLALAYFNEKLGILDGIGVGLLFLSIIIVTLTKLKLGREATKPGVESADEESGKEDDTEEDKEDDDQDEAEDEAAPMLAAQRQPNAANYIKMLSRD